MKLEQVAINAVSTMERPLEELCAAFAQAGFRNVEFPLPIVKKYLETGRTVADVRKILEQHRLKCIGGFETIIRSFGEPGEIEQNHAATIKNAQLIADLGGGTLVFGTDGPQTRSIDALSTIGKTLSQVAGRAPASVTLAVEFNWSPVVKSLKAAKRVVDAAAHPRVGILFDPAHFHCMASKTEDLTPDVIKKIVHVHVDDMRDIPGDWTHCNDDRVLPGEGCIDLKALLRRIEQGGYRGHYSIELFNRDLWQMPADEAARLCYRAMQSLCA